MKVKGDGSRLFQSKRGTVCFVLIEQVLRCTKRTLWFLQHRKFTVQGNFLHWYHESTLQIKAESQKPRTKGQGLRTKG